ncbi:MULTISPECIES: hypothetical protein [Streptomyces]|uniref:hypothetical protein n=1 Tax=Streptomyces TaxID=1883 RepID=UPI0022496C25|nr:hypothetical protein [Streptomyces sp. JHD 1]MCX2967882.1 hypothetical protein [Streptomyces sp. JHD 1]
MPGPRPPAPLAAACAVAVVAVAGPSAGAAAAAEADPGRGVIVQPTRVAPGQEFSVLDGGACAAATGTASFVPPPDGERFPDLRLGPLRDMVGGTGVVPEDAAPGYYRVNVVCGGEGPFSASFTVAGGPGSAGSTGHAGGGDGVRDAGGDAHRAPPGAPPRKVAETDAGGGATVTAGWALGGAGVLALLGGALWLGRRGGT